MVIDITEYYISNSSRKVKKLEWRKLWIYKSDYIINYYKNISGKYRIIDESIDYYIVLLELGIFYLKKYDSYYDYALLQHELIINDLNDSNLKYDFKERKFAEYIKYLFFYKTYSIDFIYNLIEKNIGKLNFELVVARLLFPSYYFYYFEKVVVNNEKYDNLANIVIRASEYEDYLKSIVNKINSYLDKKIVLPF